MYEGFDENNLHLFATQFLINDAGDFIDKQTIKPKNWSEFKILLEKRFGKKKPDKTTLMKNITHKETGKIHRHKNIL